MVRNTKILKHAAREEKEVLKKVYFRLLCVRVHACEQVDSVHALAVWFRGFTQKIYFGVRFNILQLNKFKF
jgi:hypothetical protein